MNKINMTAVEINFFESLFLSIFSSHDDDDIPIVLLKIRLDGINKLVCGCIMLMWTGDESMLL